MQLAPAKLNLRITDSVFLVLVILFRGYSRTNIKLSCFYDVRIILLSGITSRVCVFFFKASCSLTDANFSPFAPQFTFVYILV